MSDFEDLAVDRWVHHEIFKGQGLAPGFRDSVDTEPKHLAALSARLSGMFGDHTKSIEVDVKDCEDNAVFQTFCRLMHDHDKEFVDRSKPLAEALTNAIASTSAPAGIMAVMAGYVGLDLRCFAAIIKAEVNDSGFSDEVVDGRPVSRLVENLYLTKSQKFFKGAIFIETGECNGGEDTDRDSEDFQVFLFDHNLTSSSTSHRATYFLEDFLNCEFKSTAKKQTRDFFLQTKAHIDSSVTTDLRKAELNQQLYAYVKSNRNVVGSKDFADNSLTLDESVGYLMQMDANGFPRNSVTKDASGIKKLLGKQTLFFSSKVLISSPADVPDSVTVMESTPDHVIVKIKGRIVDK